jgi:hypothetical protein
MLETMGKMVFKMMASVEVSEDMTAGGGSQKGDTTEEQCEKVLGHAGCNIKNRR